MFSGRIARCSIKKRYNRSYSEKNAPRIPSLPLFQKIAKNTGIAIATADGDFSFPDIVRDASDLRETIQDLTKTNLSVPFRVASLTENSFNYVRSQFGTWAAGGTFVPLCTSHPPAELEYFLDDSQSSIAICDQKFEPILRPLAQKRNIPCHVLPNSKSKSTEQQLSVKLDPMDGDKDAMIIYTSGTTGKPKGVVTSHNNIQAQIDSMIEPWGWSSKDHILHTLPLHHVHGVVNVLLCSLYAGARCQMLPHFDAATVWNLFKTDPTITLYMAVPTIYSRLISEYDKMDPKNKEEASKACHHLRLMVSGSAALPTTIMNRWKEITGHTLLERYGMTEVGMALSNPLNGERKPGTVGFPLPKVECRLINDGQEVKEADASGELRLKGPSIFKGYFNRPEATKETFDEEGWFKTGDIATRDASGRYSIMGRSSVDIIKSGGYKISALDIERELLEHPEISECAVLGIPDPEWGQKIVVITILKPGSKLDITGLKNWAKSKMAGYKIPKEMKNMEIPRNAMGKVNKKELLKIWMQ